jgi:hypothetical protein
LAVSPTSLFGNQQVGTPTAIQTVTVSNPAGAPTLLISNIAFIGANGSQYTRQNTVPNDCGTVYPKNLAAGTSCTIGLVFSPTSTGSKTETLRISLTQNTATTVNVSLNGRGVNLVTINLVSLTFGSSGSPIARGSNSATQTITLTNPAGNPTFSGINLSFPTYFNRLGGTCGFSLTAGNSCTINVRYSPTAATPATNPTTGTLTINNSAGMNPSGPPTVSLSGWHN